MMRRSSVLIALSAGLLIAGSASAASDGLPYSWYVNANGAEGSLQIATAPGGQVTGTLMGEPVTGWLVGRHLVLARHTSDGDESWEGWIATAENVHDGERPVIAGTIIRPGQDGPLPWFGAARSLEQVMATAPPPPAAPPSVPRVTSSQPSAPASRAATARRPTTPPRLATGQPDVGGTWQTPDGPLEIRQEGSKLTFLLPDRQVGGRITGPDSLIGGFGPGCCKGHLEQAFTVIVWSNGIRWYRQ